MPQPLIPHGGRAGSPTAPQTEENPSAHLAHSLQTSPSSAVRGRVRSLPARGQLCPPGVVTAASPGLAQSQGLTPAVLSTGSPTALQGRDWPHFQMWKTRGHLAVAQDSVEGEAWPPGPRPLPNPLLHHEGPPALSWGQGPENGVPCAHSSLQVVLSRKQRARGSPVGRPSHTHGWHVPLPAHSPQRPQRAGAPCYKLGADKALWKAPPHREDPGQPRGAATHRLRESLTPPA